jgi:DNA-binding HxlR family transcriptional regulator
MYKVKGRNYPCCTSVTMGIIGGKWKSVILYHLIEGTLRYNELSKKMTDVTERTLSLQLKDLEEDGVILRTVYTTKPPLKVEYSLTTFGKTLIPLLQSIANWGDFVVENYADVETVASVVNSTNA